MHGTGVAGILAANTPGHNLFVGMVPFAELYMIDSSKDKSGQGGADPTMEKLVWAKDQDMDIVLFEFSSWGLTFMDGTSNLENAIDQLYEKNGILQVVPAGNLADSGKHIYTQLATGSSQLGVTIPELLPGYDYYPFETPLYIFSLYWQGETDDMALEVALPEGSFAKVPVQLHEPLSLGSHMEIVSYASKSQAGIVHRMCYIFDDQQEEVIQGEWTWKLTNNSGQKLPLHGFVQDSISSWGRTIEFDKRESEDTTICHPSTADAALSVAAFGGEFGPHEELGKIRPYSSRGPRMDGMQAIDIAAPDDPYTPLARLKTGMFAGNKDIKASYTVFGGTSGAGPHVAGAAALLMQLNPYTTPQEIFQAITAGAVVEPDMGSLPNKEWGHGKLNIFQAKFGQMPFDNLPPVVSVQVLSRNGLNVSLDASESYDPELGPLDFRWDFDYDGVWDTKWLSVAGLEYLYQEEVDVTIKVGVRDGPGAVSEALLSFEVRHEYAAPDGEPDAGRGDPEDVRSPPGDHTGGSEVDDPPFVVDSGSSSDGKGKKKGGGCSLAAVPTEGPWALLLSFLVLCTALWACRRKDADAPEKG